MKPASETPYLDYISINWRATTRIVVRRRECKPHLEYSGEHASRTMVGKISMKAQILVGRAAFIPSCSSGGMTPTMNDCSCATLVSGSLGDATPIHGAARAVCNVSGPIWLHFKRHNHFHRDLYFPTFGRATNFPDIRPSNKQIYTVVAITHG